MVGQDVPKEENSGEFDFEVVKEKIKECRGADEGWIRSGIAIRIGPTDERKKV